MATLAITIEEIKKCISIKEKNLDCVKLLYNAEAKKLLQEKSKEKEEEYNSKQTELEKEEVKLKEVEALWLEKVDNYNNAKSTRDNVQSNYDTKNQEKETAREKLKSEENHESNQRQKAIYAVDSSSAWYNVDNLNDLKSARDNNKKWGHVEDNYSDKRYGVNKCTYASSPKIHIECEKELDKKIAEFERYDRYQGDTLRAREKLTEKEKELSSAKNILDQREVALKSLEEQKKNAEEARDSLRADVIQLQMEVNKEAVILETGLLEGLNKFNAMEIDAIQKPEDDILADLGTEDVGELGDLKEDDTVRDEL